MSYPEGFTYVSVPYIECRELASFSEADFKKLSYYQENRREFEQLEALYGSSLKSSFIAAVKIAYVDEEIGYGLFAEAPISRGSLIGEYTGLVRYAREITPDDCDENGSYPDDWAWDYPVDIPGLPPLEIDARRAGNELRYVNHSFQGNLRPDHLLVDGRWALIFVADRDISPGEELCIDYGEAYWSGGFRELVLR